MTVPPRLSHLMELADQGPALRAALAEEVAELLMAWPADYPKPMRAMCETLLAQAARDADGQTRAQLKTQLEADPELAARVLPRDEARRALIAAARGKTGLGEALARALGVPPAVAAAIVHDASGKSLALAVKGAHWGRCDYSGLALLAHPQSDRALAYALLDVYDAVTPADATRALRGWRAAA